MKTNVHLRALALTPTQARALSRGFSTALSGSVSSRLSYRRAFWLLVSLLLGLLHEGFTLARENTMSTIQITEPHSEPIVSRSRARTLVRSVSALKTRSDARSTGRQCAASSTARPRKGKARASGGNPGNRKPAAARELPGSPLGNSRRYVIDACEDNWMVLVGESLQTPEVLHIPARLLPDGCSERALVQLRTYKGWSNKQVQGTGKRSRLQVIGIQPPAEPGASSWKGGPKPIALNTQTSVWCRAGQKAVMLSRPLFHRLPPIGTRLTLEVELVSDGAQPAALLASRPSSEPGCPAPEPALSHPTPSEGCFWDLTQPAESDVAKAALPEPPPGS